MTAFEILSSIAKHSFCLAWEPIIRLGGAFQVTIEQAKSLEKGTHVRAAWIRGEQDECLGIIDPLLLRNWRMGSETEPIPAEPTTFLSLYGHLQLEIESATGNKNGKGTTVCPQRTLGNWILGSERFSTWAGTYSLYKNLSSCNCRLSLQFLKKNLFLQYGLVIMLYLILYKWSESTTG